MTVAGVGQHSNQAGVFGVHVRKQHDRLGAELGCNPGVLWPGPDGKVEKGHIDRFGSQHPAIADCDFILPDDFVSLDHFETFFFQSSHQAPAQLRVNGIQLFL